VESNSDRDDVHVIGQERVIPSKVRVEGDLDTSPPPQGICFVFVPNNAT